MAERIMEDLLRAPTEGYGEAIILTEINADHFEIKTNLLQLVQANPFHGLENKNPHAHINSFKRITSTLRFRNVPNHVIKLMMFPYSLEGDAKTWYEKEPPNSILTWEDLVTKFVNQFFPLSKMTHLKNKISQFTQKFDESFSEAWERFKEMLRACTHHGFTELTQVDTFYNGLNDNDQDSLNAAAGGNLLSKTTREALNIIENKLKVRYSRNNPNASRMNTTSRESDSKMDERIDKLADQLSTLVEIVSKKVVTPAPLKRLRKLALLVVVPILGIIVQLPITIKLVFVRLRNQASTSGTLPSNTILNPKGEMKSITTRSGFAYEGPSIPTNPSPKKVVERETEEITDKEQSNFQGSTAHIPPPVTPILTPEPDVPKTLPNTTPIPKPDVPKSLPKPNIPYPSRRDDQKFAPTIKSLLMNKEKLLELAKILLNENCSAMLLKKLPEKLGDPGKFLIPCNFPGMDVCHALADLGASINLMPLSIWKKLSLPDLTPTRMTLELADRSITYPKGLAEDVFVKVGKFHFPTDFVVVDFEADPRVPLILGRSFLRTGRALIDVYGEEITLRVDNEAVTFNLDQTTRYSSINDKSVNRIDIIDVVCEEEGIVLGHKISKPGIEVDRVKIDVIAKLPHPTTVKGVRSFLGHAGFYRRFIQDFSKIARPMTHLLEKETPFVFSKDCIDAFQTLKKKLTEAPILIVPDWNLPFELMCDASDFAIGAVLGQRRSKHFQPIHYASKTMTEAQIHYTTTEKEMLAWVEAKALPTNDARVVFAKVTSKYGVTHRLATAYHPQTSGQVEVSNRGLKRIIERTVGENRASWFDKLDDALWAFRTAFKTPIGCTPYKLVYGKSFHLPIELEHKAYWALKHANFDLKTMGDHRKLQLNELNELRNQAYENSLIYKERTKKLHDSKIKNRIFNVGDRVLLFNSRLKIFSGKLKTRWSRPFTITKVFSYGTIELSQTNGPNFKVNCHRVKHYFGEDLTPKVRIVQKLQENGKSRTNTNTRTDRVEKSRKNLAKGSGYQQKDRKPSQNDKTEHGMERLVQNQAPKSKNAKVRVIPNESAVKSAGGNEESIGLQYSTPI
ncbi:reverse transcriptase domain-containing protein [Tanacetum coccineum]